MKKDVSRLVARVASDPTVAEQLDFLLQHQDDRAYVLCTISDCQHNLHGHCTVYTVTALNAGSPDKPCAEYKKRQ
jgi:hypothetical protein